MEKNNQASVKEGKPTKPLLGAKKDRTVNADKRKEKESWSEVDGEEEMRKKEDDKRVKK